MDSFYSNKFNYDIVGCGDANYLSNLYELDLKQVVTQYMEKFFYIMTVFEADYDNYDSNSY